MSQIPVPLETPASVMHSLIQQAENNTDFTSFVKLLRKITKNSLKYISLHRSTGLSLEDREKYLHLTASNKLVVFLLETGSAKVFDVLQFQLIKDEYVLDPDTACVGDLERVLEVVEEYQSKLVEEKQKEDLEKQKPEKDTSSNPPKKTKLSPDPPEPDLLPPITVLCDTCTKSRFLPPNHVSLLLDEWTCSVAPDMVEGGCERPDDELVALCGIGFALVLQKLSILTRMQLYARKHEDFDGGGFQAEIQRWIEQARAMELDIAMQQVFGDHLEVLEAYIQYPMDFIDMDIRVLEEDVKSVLLNECVALVSEHPWMQEYSSVLVEGE